MSLLVFNAGSGSLKFAAYELGTAAPLLVVRGGLAPLDHNAVLRIGDDEHQIREALPYSSPVQAVHDILRQLEAFAPMLSPPSLVAHRVVYGESGSAEVAAIDDALLARLRSRCALAPLHQHLELDMVEAAAAALGAQVPAFAAFDSGFFSTLSRAATSYAVPERLRSTLDLRRRGFHGFAHRSMLHSYCAAASTDPAHLRLVSFQLGGGCSVAAIRDGRPVDTSMGYTPLEGLVMATRCGDLDPGAIFQALRSGITAEDLHHMLEAESGLLGLSGLSADMNAVLAAAQDHDAARLAVEVYCGRARKYLGAYLAVLCGADAVVFGGGVGEHLAQVRSCICGGMEWLGLELDERANQQASTLTRCISSAGSRIAVYVAPVDEERVIAGAVLDLLNHSGKRNP